MPVHLKQAALVMVALALFLINPSLSRAEGEHLAIYLDRDSMLYSLPVTGGAETLLNPTDVEVVEYEVARTGHVVLLADDGFLYSVPVGGGTSVKLSQNQLAAGDREYYFPFVINADGSYVVYLGRDDQGKTGLYSVPVTGGTPVALMPDNLTFLMNRYQPGRSWYMLAPDGTKVIFAAKTARDVTQLYVVPVAGGEAKQINGRLASGGNVRWATFSPDSQYVLYLADQSKDELLGYYVVPVEGGDVVTITEGQDGYHVSDSADFPIITPGGRVIFTLWSGRGRLYSVPLEGGAATQLDDQGKVGAFRLLETTRNAILYDFAQGSLYIVMEDGSERRLLSNVVSSFETSPDHQTMFLQGGGNVLAAKLPPPGSTDAGTAGAGYLAPEGRSVVTGTYGRFALLTSPDGRYALTLARDREGIAYLYSTILEGKNFPPPVQLNSRTGTSGYDPAASITADSTTVVYINNEETANVADLYSVPIDGGEAIRLTTDDSPGAVSVKLYPVGANWIPYS